MPAWTPEETELAKRMYAAGDSFSAIGDAVGRTGDAVQSLFRVWRRNGLVDYVPRRDAKPVQRVERNQTNRTLGGMLRPDATPLPDDRPRIDPAVSSRAHLLDCLAEARRAGGGWITYRIAPDYSTPRITRPMQERSLIGSPAGMCEG